MCVLVKCVHWIRIKDVPPPFSGEHFLYGTLQPHYVKSGKVIIFEVFELGAYQNTSLIHLIVFLKSVAVAAKPVINSVACKSLQLSVLFCKANLVPFEADRRISITSEGLESGTGSCFQC